MKKKQIRYIFLIMICLLSFSACKKSRKDLVTFASIDTLAINTSTFEHPFEIPVNKSSLRYVRLATNRPFVITHIDELRIVNSTIFILDRKRKSIILFDIAGKFKKSVTIKNTQFQYFDIFGDAIYVLDKNQSKIFKFDFEGNLLKTFNQNFHGVQFAVLPGERFIYYTSGLSTRDGNSENYQLSISGPQKTDMQLPYKRIYSGIKYFFEDQFSRNGDHLFFISAFENVFYKVDTLKIVALTKFDFGKYNMPDSVFLKGKDFDNFNAFPYVSDLVNVANTVHFSFFKFSYHNRQGYIVCDYNRKKIIAGGIDVATDAASDFNNIVPVCSYGDKFIAIISPRTWLRMSSEMDLSKTLLNKKYPKKTICLDDSPILLFYTLL
ncbi:6-bladed beta-propeller [Mucilaginibacter sp. UR6-11]|uniref:6-bladed beta-propeller n=1 Tax=Mucilaginibacter sp. UR6-11 TaxID=1435644 RepID=UPI001E37855E|nr:6-bladed beta-propeller [Mucilaginibacter sp. UR6-11]MCC8427312.1 6-bladed beta-propeller [Mucilaginibacter sp. UR6-11]